MTVSIGITMGDPAGVGAEVICKALAKMSPGERSAIRVFGSPETLATAASITGCDIDFTGGPNSVLVDDAGLATAPIPFGQVNPAGGEASFRYIERAVAAATSGEIACIVTAPINKEALNAAGHHYDGHTGMLAALTGSRSSFMLLTSPRMSVIHVSTHVSLRDAITRATTARIVETIRAGHDHLRRIGIARPRIAVAGINPHCGEGGLFGREDDEQVTPAIATARLEGIDVVGPIPADTVYHRCYSGAFDLVVAQYHDQGHIPMKLVAFDTTVNVSLGLPIDRTSVDHGTAFDIAGTGQAKHDNMLAAIAYAQKLASNRKATT